MKNILEQHNITVFRMINNMKEFSEEARNSGKTIGLIPTMGCLHDGHLSLIRQAKQENDIVILSIYVNPTQFSQGEDFEKYPRNFENDKKLAQRAGVNIIFYPMTDQLYPEGLTMINYATPVFLKLCGITRPTHFQGVCTIVSKLFDVIHPTKAYFGRKDYQQYAIIKQMCSDLRYNIDVVGCPTVREEDGLAMSSRNTYLTSQEREKALCLYDALNTARELIFSGEKDIQTIKDEIIEILSDDNEIKIDYIAVVDKNTFDNVDVIRNGIIICIAIFVGNTRLIDNLIVE